MRAGRRAILLFFGYFSPKLWAWSQILVESRFALNSMFP
ncbi:Uncharacterized protein ChrSV_1251 [Chromobacterium vaccinii]|nr:Uncharacterized protein ChrSW_1251 [Chromobacterium vaccinii]QND88709.1 Uncharacterized protein ChrSV_1251 [Chromobacterium vaccinii]